MIVYHGSDQIVKQPLYGKGKEDNDYGAGFYLTEEKDKANAWAVVNGTDKAYCNMYELPIDELNVLYLDQHGVLAWIAEVTAHRGVTDEDAVFLAQKLVDMYKIDTTGYDAIVGYRADDSYIRVIESFLKGQVTADEVERFFRKGNLGEQVFIKSRKAFQSIQFVNAEPVLKKMQYQDYDAQARREVESFLNNRRKAIQLDGFMPSGMTIQNILDVKFVYDSQYHYYQPEEEPNKEQEEEGYER